MQLRKGSSHAIAQGIKPCSRACHQAMQSRKGSNDAIAHAIKRGNRACHQTMQLPESCTVLSMLVALWAECGRCNGTPVRELHPADVACSVAACHDPVCADVLIRTGRDST
eukprot:365625-Chlamydomonas_euryale.AAC.8